MATNSTGFYNIDDSTYEVSESGLVSKFIEDIGLDNIRRRVGKINQRIHALAEFSSYLNSHYNINIQNGVNADVSHLSPSSAIIMENLCKTYTRLNMSLRLSSYLEIFLVEDYKNGIAQSTLNRIDNMNRFFKDIQFSKEKTYASYLERDYEVICKYEQSIESYYQEFVLIMSSLL